MKKTVLILLSLFLLDREMTFAQWQTNGPYSGPVYSLLNSPGILFCGTENGVFSSPDNGQSWTAANTGLERKTVGSLAKNSAGIYAGLYSEGVYMSSTNGTNWTAVNNGLTDLNVSSLQASDSGIFAGTASGVYFSSDNGNSWSLSNNGIPSTYVIYCFARMGDTVYGGSYGMGLYRTNNNGGSWTAVNNGFPTSAFVYALIADGNNLYAGTSSGIYKSSDRGNTWYVSNTGFPSGMWAKSFAVKPGYIFAGTYSEGVFVSTDNGATWSAANTGIPDLPFPTGLPHNYPSVEALACAGANVAAATVDGLYLSSDSASTWYESFEQILGTNVTAIAAGYTPVFAGTERNGVYTSWDQGASWLRTNNGLTSYDVMALTVKDSSVLVSVMNQKVFRSDDYGASWVQVSSGLTSDVRVLESDNVSVLAITTGAMFTPRGLFRTFDKGMNWSQLSTSFTGEMTAVASQSNELYVGTDLGKIYYSNNSGLTWLDLSAGLPATEISSILLDNTYIYAGTNGSGVYKTNAATAAWVSANNGLANDTVKDLFTQNGTLYAVTWGGGVYSSNQAVSWSSLNTGLGDLHVSAISGNGSGLYAGTDAGAYSLSSANAVAGFKDPGNVIIYPNPGSGIINIRIPSAQNARVTISDCEGRTVYEYKSDRYSGGTVDLTKQARGLYILSLQTQEGTARRKIIIE